ncbi:MAG: Ferrochelatase [Candidatus Omnitrophica bacterium]|nr:Ferrochelatase [Candidatus Omnitrophota bacterium]
MTLRTLVILGFGGPEGPQEVEPFLDSVLKGVPVPPERRREVASHYEHFEGRSPYNAKALLLRDQLRSLLEIQGRPTRVLAAFRHARPSYAELMAGLAGSAEPPAVFVLSALRSGPSYGKYIEAYTEAARASGIDPLVRELPGYHTHPEFVRMQSELLAAVPGGLRPDDAVVFAAHSIPQRASDESGYARQFEELSAAIAARTGLARHWTAYQSRSGRPQDPWLGPDVLSVLSGLPSGVRRVVLVPVGFLCENIEILYDLDIEARDAALAAGRSYERTRAVMDHPDFARFVAGLYGSSTAVRAVSRDRRPRIAVLGAGISGLSAAYEIARSGIEAVVYEASASPGGSIGSERREGFLLEHGPDSFLSEKPGMLELCRELGIEDQLQGTCAERRRSYVLRGGKLIEIPPGFYLIAPSRLDTFLGTPLFSPLGKIRLLAEALIPARRDDADESVGDFIRRRFGREALDRAGQPLLAGIYTGDPDQLSLLSTMPRFRQLEREHGSVIRGLLRQKQAAARRAQGPRYDLFLTLRDGMATAVACLVRQLPATALRLSSAVSSIRREASGWTVEDIRGGSERYDAVLSALPAYATAALTAPLAPELSRLLESVPYESVATLNIAYDRSAISDPLDGFGFVVPRTERLPLVACSYSSRKYDGRAPEGQALLRAFVGGAFGREAYASEDSKLEREALGALERVLGIGGRPHFTVLKRYPRAMVQYRVGHSGLIASARRLVGDLPGLALAGSAFSGAGIPDGVSDARAQARKLVEYVRSA